MSSKFVRDTMTAAWAGLLPGIALVVTDNVEPKGMVAPWAALDFTAYNDDRDSLGLSHCRLEEGEVFINLFIDSGQGNQALIDAMDQVVQAWRTWEDATGNLKIVGMAPMEEFPESSGLWYGGILGLRYEFRYFI
jgi:hypothetical protein